MLLAHQNNGLGEATGGTGIDSSNSNWLDNAIPALKDLVTQYNQQQIMQANIDRAKMGLPPIDTAAIAPTYNVGLAPEVKQMMMFGGIALLFVMLLRRG